MRRDQKGKEGGERYECLLEKDMQGKEIGKRIEIKIESDDERGRDKEKNMERKDDLYGHGRKEQEQRERAKRKR